MKHIVNGSVVVQTILLKLFKAEVVRSGKLVPRKLHG